MFTHLGDYKRHISRATPCVLEKSDTVDNIAIGNVPNLINNNTCKYCNRYFTRRDNLDVHIKSRCKVKFVEKQDENTILKDPVVQTMMDEMKELRKQNELLMAEVFKSKQNINNQQNIDKQMNVDKQIVNNNVKLVAFGKEDMSCITDAICKQILSKGFQSVPKLIEYMHFNNDKPEYQNIYIPNYRNNMAMIFDGDDWGLRDRDDALDQLKNEKAEFLAGKFNELLKAGELSEATIKKMRRFIKEKDEDPADTNIKNDIKLLLYNKRNQVIKNKKKLIK
jgi:hypothetical protein